MPNIIASSEKSRATSALERTNGWYAAAAGLVEVGKTVRNKWREAHNYTVTITSADVIYQDVHDWLLDNVPVHDQRALAAHSSDRRDEEYGETVGESGPARLHLTYDSSREQVITVDGHKVKVNLEVDQSDLSDRQKGYRFKPDKITFFSQSQAGQQAVIEHLKTIVASRKETKRRPQLWMLSTWGSWVRRMDLPLRTPESVVLRKGQMEALVDDLDGFLQRESDYVRRGIPWHRGYLLQGPPGTGKTSVAKALAHRFNLDLWYAPLGDLDKDANLLALLSEVRPRSMLLLEDIDIYHAATSREAESGSVTLSGLLNALDGVSTPHGLITVLTSNEPKELDDALIRPGRIDRIEDVDYVTQEQAERLFAYFYNQPPEFEWRVEPQTSAADLTEVFKRHMDNPAAAEGALRRDRM